MTAVQTTTTDTAAPAGGHIIINGRKAVHIPLETAIERKGETITAVHLMKPLAGDLRGLLLAELLQTFSQLFGLFLHLIGDRAKIANLFIERSNVLAASGFGGEFEG